MQCSSIRLHQTSERVHGINKYFCTRDEPFGKAFTRDWASLIVQLIKNLPAMQETLVQFPGWEDPLEKGKATHSRILAWRIP